MLHNIETHLNWPVYADVCDHLLHHILYLYVQCGHDTCLHNCTRLANGPGMADIDPQCPVSRAIEAHYVPKAENMKIDHWAWIYGMAVR